MFNWVEPNNWRTVKWLDVDVVDYINTHVLLKHDDGRIFCTNSGKLRTMDRDGKNFTDIYDFRANGYPNGYIIQSALLLPTGTMLVFVTNWADPERYIMRSTNTNYTEWEQVLDQWNGGFIYRSWSCNPEGTVLAGEYPTRTPLERVRIWKGTNDGRDWEVLHTFHGRESNAPKEEQIYHIHCVVNDPYTGLWWINTGDNDHECGVYKSDGNSVTLVGEGNQLWRAVSFTFRENHVIWGSDGKLYEDGEYNGYMVRLDKETEVLDRRTRVPHYMFVAEKINNKGTLLLANGTTEGDSCDVYLSHDGMDWYKVFGWETGNNQSFSVFNNFVDNLDGRVFVWTTNILRHDTGEQYNNGGIILEFKSRY